MKATLTTGNGNQRKQLRVEKTESGWDVTTWQSWKGEDWSREWQSAEWEWRCESDAERELEARVSELLNLGS